MALDETGTDGSLAVGHVRSRGPPECHSAGQNDGETADASKVRGGYASPCQAAQCCAKGLQERM